MNRPSLFLTIIIQNDNIKSSNKIERRALFGTDRNRRFLTSNTAGTKPLTVKHSEVQSQTADTYGTLKSWETTPVEINVRLFVAPTTKNLGDEKQLLMKQENLCTVGRTGTNACGENIRPKPSCFWQGNLVEAGSPRLLGGGYFHRFPCKLESRQD